MRLSSPSGYGLLKTILLTLPFQTLARTSIPGPQYQQQPILQNEAAVPHVAVEQVEQLDPSTHHQAHRIAIIGAGPAGSSAAYHLSRFATDNHLPTPLNITVFESNSYIGGRTTTVNALDDPRYPVELGASIFVDINHILYNATLDFGLPANDRIYESTGAEYDLGIWDGGDDGFLFKTKADSDDDDGGNSGWKGTLVGWWDIAKLFWRYGISPLRLRTLQKDVIGRFLQMYDAKFPFTDLTTVAGEVDLLKITGQNGDILLKEAGVGEKFSREIVQASSRVNYAQNLVDFHALGTMVCMSTEGAMSIDGGNWQIFAGMLKRSGASLRLNTTVDHVETKSDGVSYLTYKPTDGGSSSSSTDTGEEFDSIILAHPYNPSILTLSPAPNPPRKAPDYVNLHVTLFTTPYRPSPLFFGLPADAQSSVPDTILTTLPAELDPSFLGRGTEGVGPTAFWSLSTLRVLNPSTDSPSDLVPSHLSSGHIPESSLALKETQYLYKIFSPAPITAEYLSDLFGWEHSHNNKEDDNMTTGTMDEQQSLSSLPSTLITWYHEKLWQSYPYLPPQKSFETFDSYAGVGREQEQQEEGTGTGMREKVWSTAPMEMFISTMETSALSGMNIARLIVDGLKLKEAAETK